MPRMILDSDLNLSKAEEEDKEHFRKAERGFGHAWKVCVSGWNHFYDFVKSPQFLSIVLPTLVVVVVLILAFYCCKHLGSCCKTFGSCLFTCKRDICILGLLSIYVKKAKQTDDDDSAEYKSLLESHEGRMFDNHGRKSIPARMIHTIENSAQRMYRPN